MRASCEASCASRSFSVCSSTNTWALRNEAPACAANSSRLSVCDAGGSSGPGQRAVSTMSPVSPAVTGTAKIFETDVVGRPQDRAPLRAGAVGRDQPFVARRDRQHVARLAHGPGQQPERRLADQLEHLRLREPHLGDGAAQHVEDLVDVEAGAATPAQRRSSQQRAAVLGLVAAAAVRGDLGHEALGEEAARERDEEDDCEPLGDARDREAMVVEQAPAAVAGRDDAPARERADDLELDRALDHRQHQHGPVGGVGRPALQERDEQHHERVGEELEDCQHRLHARGLVA